MGVILLVQPKMPVGRGAVGGLFEAAEQLGAQGVALRMGPERDQQLHQLGAHGEVADLDAERGQQGAVFLQFLDVGLVVDAI